VKLLRVLQERSYEPVGGTETLAASFRLVAATNRDLAAEVAAGRFRSDLYYRLLVCPIALAPLRERRCDIPHLFLHFWRVRGETRPVEPPVLAALEAYDWPGNVRELENLVERLSVCSEGPALVPGDLPPNLRPSAPPAPVQALPAAVAPLPAAPPPRAAPAVPATLLPEVPASPTELLTQAAARAADALPHAPVDLQQLLRQLEDTFINAALERTAGNKKAAADLLGLQRTTLVEKLRRRERGAGTGVPSTAA
jgi:sigma-54 specific flagellar transcriptional regulator A